MRLNSSSSSWMLLFFTHAFLFDANDKEMINEKLTETHLTFCRMSCVIFRIAN